MHEEEFGQLSDDPLGYITPLVLIAKKKNTFSKNCASCNKWELEKTGRGEDLIEGF